MLDPNIVPDIEAEFTSAVLNHTMPEFVAALEARLAKNHDFKTWKYLGMAKEYFGDYDAADRCFVAAVQFADLPTLTEFAKQLEIFAVKRGKSRALSVAHESMPNENDHLQHGRDVDTPPFDTDQPPGRSILKGDRCARRQTPTNKKETFPPKAIGSAATTTRIHLRLETPVFHLDKNGAVGCMIVSNRDQNSVARPDISIDLLTNDCNTILWSTKWEVREVRADGSTFGRLHIPLVYLKKGIASQYAVRLANAGGPSRIENIHFDSGTAIDPATIPWDETRKSTGNMFFGREDVLNELVYHLKSPERVKSCLLYGLTRMGKSSLLDRFENQIDLEPTGQSQTDSRFFAVRWDFSDAANQDVTHLWRSFLIDAIVNKAKRMADAGRIPATAVPAIRSKPGFDDWKYILDSMQKNRLYPVFLIDEVTFFRELCSKNRLKPSFLAAIRNFAISGLASFLFAGTFDSRELIQRYGIGGQLVNVKECGISQIDKRSAKNLIIKPMPQLTFTHDAIGHLLQLSWRIPYFIQLLCKTVAYFAIMTGRRHIGILDIDDVVRYLTGDDNSGAKLGFTRLPASALLPCIPDSDQQHCRALLTTLCWLCRDHLNNHVCRVHEVMGIWHEHGVPDADQQIAAAIKYLQDREIITVFQDQERLSEGSLATDATCRINVDLFRRWWANEYFNVETELSPLKLGKARRGRQTT